MKHLLPVLWILLLGACASVPGPGTAGAKAMPLNESLRTAFANKQRVMMQPRTPLRFANGKTAASCDDYLALVRDVPLEESPDNFAVHSEYLVCDGLDLLGRARAGTALLDPTGTALAERLDLRSFPSSLFNRLDERTHTLQVLLPHGVRTLGSVVEAAADEHRFRLEIVAVANVAGGAAQDWIVWMADEARGGSYRAYRTFVIPDPTPDGVLRAMPAY